MGMMTLSAAFIKFAAEQRATMRDVRGNILNFAIAIEHPGHRRARRPAVQRSPVIASPGFDPKFPPSSSSAAFPRAATAERASAPRATKARRKRTNVSRLARDS